MAQKKRLRLSILLELFFDAALLLIFIAQAFIGGCLVIYGYLPLPSEWGNQMIARQLPSEVILRVDEFRLQIGGNIDLIGIDVKTAGIQQSLLKAESAEIELSWDPGFQLPEVESLVLSGGTLFTPSVYSPNGHHSPLLECIALRVIPGEQDLEVDRFAALHDTIRLRGALTIPARTESTGELDINQTLNAFYTQAAKLTQQKERINYFKTPTIAFKMNAIDAETQQIDLRISSRSLQHPEVIAEKVQLRGSIQLKGLEITPMTSPRVTATHIEVPRYELSADGLSAEIAPEQFKSLLAGNWPQLKLAAKGIHLKQFNLDAPTLKVDPSDYPEVAFRGATRSLNGAIDLTGRVNAQLWSGQVRARGSVDLVKLTSNNIYDQLPKIAFESTPYYDLKLQFNPGFQMERADLLAQVNHLQVEDLTFDHINAHASYKNGLYSIEDLYLRRQKQWLNLKFSLNSETYDYKVTLIGSAVPYDYNALLPKWWGAIFEDFDFSQTTYSLGDFIIYGNTQRKASDLYYGRAEARKVSYKGVLLDESELIVRGRGPYTELHNLTATSGRGWARGNIAFASRLDEVNGPASIRLDMEAKLTLDDAAKLFSGNVAQIISEFKTDSLPVTELKGAIFNNEYPEYAGKSFFDVSAICTKPVTFKKIPLDHLSFDLFGRSEVTYLRNVKLGYADGLGSAKIDIFTPAEQANTVRYRFTLKDADQDQALSNLPQLDALEDSLESPVSAAAPQAGREHARADMILHGEGPIEDPFQHKGFGRFEIRNDKLGTIQLLGPLSKILQNTQLSFTSFNLNKMRGDFRYENENVDLAPLRIDGARTQIQAPGRLNLKDQSLDMRVNVSLFGNAGNPDSNLRKIGDLITKPLPNLLQFELTGTLKKQKLRSLYDPRNLIPRF